MRERGGERMRESESGREREREREREWTEKTEKVELRRETGTKKPFLTFYPLIILFFLFPGEREKTKAFLI